MARRAESRNDSDGGAGGTRDGSDRRDPGAAGRDRGNGKGRGNGSREPSGAERAWSAQVNALGGFIRAQRQMAKLSLREMASMTRVSNAYLSQVERGLHQPSLKVLHSIADALQLNTEQLLAQAGWGQAGAEEERDEAPRGSATPCSVEEAVRADTRLSEEQKAALIGVYRSFVGS